MCIRDSITGDVPGAEFVDLEQLTESAAVALPVEPVGVGARWEASPTLEALGLEVSQTVTYEIVEISGDVVVLDVEISQTVPAGEELSLLGVSGTVTSWESTGSGRTTLDLVLALPSSVIETSANQSFDFGDEGTLTQTISQDVTMESESVSYTHLTLPTTPYV